jgi:hypothetical protein
MLGWLNEGFGYLNVQSGGTWTLSPLSEPSGSLYALRVQRGTDNNQWLWIEYRQPIGAYEPTILDTDAPRDFNGVLVHLEDPTQATNWPAYTELLDFQPARLPNDFNQAMLKAGAIWADPYSNLTLTIGGATPSGISVTVSFDNGCATLSAPSQSFTPLAGSGLINVLAPSSCSWNAAAGAEWITLTGTISGTGPGTIPYLVSANGTVADRSSFISISHQTITINQSAQPQGGSVSVSPSSGTGPAGFFSFAFSDPTSWNNLTWGEININTEQVTTNSCYIRWQAAGNLLYLRDNADSTWLGPIALGAAGTLANGQCILHQATATLTGAGSSATLRLNVEFTNRFANNLENVYMQSQSAATACGWQQSGTWRISFPFQPVSVSPPAASGTEEIFTFTASGFYPLSDYYDGDEVYFAFSTSNAFGTFQFYDDGCNFELGPSLTSIYLFADQAATGASNGALGSGPPLANSQCILDTAASSAQLTGSTLSVQLAITFTPTFAGRKDIYIFGPGTGWPLGASYAPVGTFTVSGSPKPKRR